jgi:hypothetical protein
MRINVTIGPEAAAILRKLESFPTAMLRACARAMDLQNQYTVSHIQRLYLSFPNSGPPVADGLRVQSNRLRSSLTAFPATIEGSQVESAIGSNVSYAAIHEFGGRTAPHEIRPKEAGGILSFMLGGKRIFARSVKHPGSMFPARAPIQHGIADRLPAYGTALSNAVVAEWEGN